MKIDPPKNPKNKNNVDQQPTDTPAESRLSDSLETANIQFRVTPAKQHEIKMYALERNMSIKKLFLELYEKERSNH